MSFSLALLRSPITPAASKELPTPSCTQTFCRNTGDWGHFYRQCIAATSADSSTQENLCFSIPPEWGQLAEITLSPSDTQHTWEYRDHIRYQFCQRFCTWEKQGYSPERKQQWETRYIIACFQLRLFYKEIQKQKKWFNPYHVSKIRCTWAQCSLLVKTDFIKQRSSSLDCFASAA